MLLVAVLCGTCRWMQKPGPGPSYGSRPLCLPSRRSGHGGRAWGCPGLRAAPPGGPAGARLVARCHCRPRPSPGGADVPGCGARPGVGWAAASRPDQPTGRHRAATHSGDRRLVRRQAASSIRTTRSVVALSSTCCWRRLALAVPLSGVGSCRRVQGGGDPPTPGSRRPAHRRHDRGPRVDAARTNRTRPLVRHNG